MKISELRIGNYIHTKGGELCTIFQLCSEDEKIKDKINYINIDEFKPIPIDLEWLEEFGFEYWGKTEWLEDRFVLHNVIDGTGNFEIFKNDDGKFTANSDFDLVCWADLKYVHQLQNIYFSINGKELKLK